MPSAFLRQFVPLSAVFLAGISSLRAEGRETVLFDEDWRFARFGQQADGSVIAEPNSETPAIRICASSEEIGPDERANTAEKALDGDPQTRWCAKGPGGGQWLELDFGETRKISKINILWETDSPENKAVLEARDSGGQWAALPENATTVRYLRLRITATPPGKWASIRELEILDDKGEKITNRLIRQPGGDPASPDFADTSWRKLDLPHDWAIEGPFRMDIESCTAKLPWRGIGWYRKTFEVPSDAKNARWYLDFDGAMADAKVFCNGKPVGGWPYGYASFRVDLTDALKPGAQNLVAVRLDTENWGSRWYPGAGIYRHVHLTRCAPVHIAQWGVFATTPEITQVAGKAQFEITADNTSGSAENIQLAVSIHELSAEGKPGPQVSSITSESLNIPAAASATTKICTTVSNPKLWNLEKPSLYLARTNVIIAGKTVDTEETVFGFRTLEFTPRDGFKINGKRVNFNGVCMHHDLGALGAAVNDRAVERQLEILKSMGCNAIRTSHNPPAPELLKAADRQGFLVMDEAFDAWTVSKKGGKDYVKLFEQWHEKDLAMLIRRDRNHPSVIMWSTGNEIPEQHNPEKFHIFSDLANFIHKLDPSRPATCGISFPKQTAFSGVELTQDVHGMNYAAGPYGGPDLYGKFLEKPGHEKLPGYSSESASTISSRGEYAPFVGPWQVDSYDLRQPGWGGLPDEEFAALDKYPAIYGEFVWTGFDYLGEPTPYNNDTSNLLNVRNDPAELARLKAELERLTKNSPPSRSSYFGIIDLAGFPKDRYYLYQARWRPELPMAHILPHWNWPGRTGTVPVFAYSSGDEAELFLNGKSQGCLKKEPFVYRFRWEKVPYEPGELKVVTWKNGKPWATETVKTTGPAAKLALTADRSIIKADGHDLSFVTLRVTDANGLTVPCADNPIHFTVKGPGRLIATDNGDPTSFVPFQSPERKAFNGLALAILQLDKNATTPITLTATSENLEKAEVTILPEK